MINIKNRTGYLIIKLDSSFESYLKLKTLNV